MKFAFTNQRFAAGRKGRRRMAPLVSDVGPGIRWVRLGAVTAQQIIAIFVFEGRSGISAEDQCCQDYLARLYADITGPSIAVPVSSNAFPN